MAYPKETQLMLGLSYVHACSWTQTNDLRPKTWLDIHGFGVIFRIVTAVQCMNLKVAMQISDGCAIQSFVSFTFNLWPSFFNTSKFNTP